MRQLADDNEIEAGHDYIRLTDLFHDCVTAIIHDSCADNNIAKLQFLSHFASKLGARKSNK